MQHPLIKDRRDYIIAWKKSNQFFCSACRYYPTIHGGCSYGKCSYYVDEQRYTHRCTNDCTIIATINQCNMHCSPCRDNCIISKIINYFRKYHI